MAETDLSDWLTVTEAATQIGCSKRTIERLASARKLEQRLRPQAGSPAIAVLNPDDVARLAAERRPEPAPFVLPAIPTGNGNGHGSLIETRPASALRRSEANDPIRQLATYVLKALQSPPSPPNAVPVAEMAETPWVDVPTAAGLLGRSVSYVQRAIKDGRLHAERDRCVVVRRKDLEQL
jgi:hypothetical protein